MKVSCPNCQTSYELADDKVKKDRMKMRCSRCKHAFYFDKKKSGAPAPPATPPATGFEELSGPQSNVPAEFEQITKPSEAFEEFANLEPGVPSEFQNIESPPIQRPPVHPSTPAPAAISPSTPAALQRSENSSSSLDIYETGVSAWDLTPSLIIDAPEIEDPAAQVSKATRRTGQLMFGLVVTSVLFFLFVAFRNGWSLEFDSLPEQIAGAFAATPKSDVPDVAQGLTISIGEKKVLPGVAPKLVVTGEVTNQTGEPRQAILLRGRLRTLTDSIISEVKAPCDMVIDEQELIDGAPGAHRKKYVRSGSLYNCRLNVDGSTIFQLVFDNLPGGFDPVEHSVSAQVISAKP